MDDIELMARDRAAVMQTATMNLNLTARENPENVTVLHDKAKELGIPFEWAKDLDNSLLHKPLSAAELQKLYSEKGVPYPARVDLARRGYRELSPGVYLKDGEVIRNPVLSEDTLGPRERALVDRAMTMLRDSTGYDVKGFQAYVGLSERGRKVLLGKVLALAERENALLSMLNRRFPAGWQQKGDKDIRKKVRELGEDYGEDFSDISIERLKKGGMGEVDLLEAVNVHGLRDLYKFVTTPSPEELAAIGADSPVEDQLRKLDYLAKQSLDLRGRTTAGQVLNVVTIMIPYMIEFAATGGLASVGKGTAKVGLGTAVRSTLREGGFTGWGAGTRALFSKQGWKAAGQAAGMILKGEAKRLPAFAPKIAITAYNEWRGGPVYYINDGVKVALPEREVDELATLIVQKTLQTYMGNVSEWGGEFLPAVDLAKFIPKPWRNRLVQQFVTDISHDNAKRAIFKNAFAGSIPLQGTLPEIVEEWINNAMERASTVGYEITGLRALDMGRSSVFGNAEENTVIAISSLVGSTGGKVLRLPGAVRHYRQLARFVDTHRGMADAMEKTKLIRRSPTQAKLFLDTIRGGDVLLQVDPEDAATFMEQNPEFARALGITENSVAEARDKGLLLQVSQNQLIVEQAKDPAGKAAGEQLLGAVQQAGVSVKEALAADMGEEAVSAFTEQRERIERFTTRIYTACEAAARNTGASDRAVHGFSVLAAFMVNHLAQHTTLDGEIEAALDKLTVEFVNDPESFAAAPLPEESEESLSNEEAREWKPRIDAIVAKPLAGYGSLNLDQGEMRSRAYQALIRAKKSYRGDGGAKFSTYAEKAIDNALSGYTLQVSRRKEVSLNKPVGDKGNATLEDILSESSEHSDEAETLEEAEVNKAKRTAMGRAIAALTPDERDIFMEVASGVKSQVEKAAERGESKENFHQKYHRVLEKVRALANEQLTALYQEDPQSLSGSFIQADGRIVPLARGLKLSGEDVRGDLAAYIAEHIGEVYTVASDGNRVEIGNKLPHEYTRSTYSEKLRSSKPELWNAKVEGASVLGGMIEIADNRGPAQLPKHGKHLPGGVFVEYDTRLAVPISESGASLFGAKLVVYEARSGRHFLYDVKEIKKLGADVIYDTRLTSEQIINILHQGKKSSGRQVVRGATQFAADFNTSFNAVVTLFKAANASTLPHEAAHWVKRMMEALVSSGHADEQLTRELETINKWLDRQTYQNKRGTEEYQREREEMFARAFETYIQTGRPPASGVEAAFNTLKHFLMAIYRYVRALPKAYGFSLDDEIVGVFDSMLSTDELIEKESPLREAVETLKETYQGLLGLSQEEARDFIRLIREAEAQMADTIEQRKRKLLPPLRKEWTKQAEDIMKNMKVYQAWNAVVAAGGLDYKSLVAMVGKDTAEALRAIGLTGKIGADGADVPLLAEKFGYASPEAMVSELLSTSAPKNFKAQYLAKQELKFHADLHLDEAAMSARAAITTLDRLTELLAEKGGIEGYRLRKGELLAAARREIDAMAVGDVVNDRKHLDAIRDLNKKLVKAIGKKDFASSLDLAEKIRRNLVVLREKADAKTTVEKTRRLLRRAGEAKRGTIYGDYHEALKELAYCFGFSKRQPAAPPEGESFRKRAASLRSDTEVFGDTFDWPDFLFREDVGSFKNLTYADFAVLADFARYLYGEGRELVKEAKGTFAARVEERVTNCVETLGKQKEKYDNRQDKTAGEKALAYVRSFLHWGNNLNTFLGRADQFSHMGEAGVRGPNLMLRDLLVEAEARMIALAEAAKTPCAEAVKALDESTRNMKLPQVEFKGDGLLHGYSKWTREMVVAACLNMGNEINRQRLMDGYEWKEEDLAKIASCLTEADWQNIQKIWDALGGDLQAAVSQTFLEENHYHLKLVPAQAFSVRTADGKSIEVRGGYYPIKYTHRTHGKDVKLGYSPRQLHAEVSSLHRRAEHLNHPDPVKLSLLIPLNHIQEMARYAATRMACREVLSVIRDKRYETAFGRTQSFESYEQVKALIMNIANPSPVEQDAVSAFERWGRTALTATALMGNLKTAAMQSASLTVGANELGSYYMESLLAFASGGSSLMAEIRAKSAMMANRAEYFDIDLRTAVNSMVDTPVEKARKTFAKGGYYLMRYLDAGVASVGWYGKYLQTVNRLTAEGVDPDLIEAKAIAQADDFVARTQGASRTLDLTPAQLKSIGRLVSPFITAAGAQYNTLLESFGAMRNHRLSAGEAFGAVLTDLLAPAVFSGLIAAFANGLFGDDDDKERAIKRGLQEMISNPFGGMPVFRDVTVAAAGSLVDAAFGGKKLYRGDILDVGGLRAINDIFSALRSGGDAALDGNWARAAWMWSDAIGSATYTPAIRIYTRAKKLYTNNGGKLPEFLQAIDDTVKSQPKKGVHKW